MIKVGVVGLGRIGCEFEDDVLRRKPASHIGAYAVNDECQIEAVCDVDVKKAEKVSKRWDVPYFYDDYKTMLKLHSFDIVSICTPTETHATILYQAVQHSTPKPNIIFCEKPLAHNLEAAKEMVRVCRENNVKLAVNHTRRWNPTYRLAKEMVDTGRIGEVICIVGHASREKDFDGNIHMFDLFSWFSGNRLDICKYIDCHPTNYLIFELEIVGSAGRILIYENGRTLDRFIATASHHYDHINELELAERHVERTRSGYTKEATPMARAVMDLVNCVKSGKKPLCTGEDGLNALQMYHAWREKTSLSGVVDE